MHRLIRSRVLLTGVIALAGLSAWGQTLSQAEKRPPSLEAAVLYSPLGANVTTGNGFWAQGGSLQVVQRLYRGLGVAADVSGSHTGSMQNSGAGLSLVTATFGPRYTWAPRRSRMAFFGHALAGVACGFDGAFPHPSGTTTAADSQAFQLGGGMNYALMRPISWRVLEADWVRTELPNATTNAQNNLRLGAGVVLHLR